MAQGVWDKTGLTATDTATSADWEAVGSLDTNITLDLVDDVDADVNPVLRLYASSNRDNSATRFTQVPASDTLEVLSRAKYAEDVSVQNRGNGPKFCAYMEDPRVGAYQRTEVFPDDSLRLSQGGGFIVRGLFATGGVSQEGRWEWYRTRIEPTGNAPREVRQRAKWWLGAVTDEPAGWQADIIYSIGADEPITGYPALQVRNATDDHYVDFYSWGTDGDSAPTSAAAIGPDTPVNPSITNLLATSARLNWEQG